MFKTAIVLLAILIAASVGAREATLTVTPLNLPSLAKSDLDCELGNMDFDGIQGYYGDWWWGFESYAYFIDPINEGCVCAEEFALSGVHMLLALDTDTNILVQGALWTAVDDGAGCFVPGVELYAGDVYTISGIPVLDYYDVSAPIDDQRVCLDSSQPYFIVFHFLDDGAAAIGLTVDSSPTACTAYNEWGSGWSDLVVAAEFVGDILMWGDIDCCIDSVPVDDSTWGDVKALFR